MRIHMMAIGGTGMSALAGALISAGHDVTGCDGTIYPPMSDQLNRLKIIPFLDHKKEHLTPAPDLLIIGNSIHKNNDEAIHAIKNNIQYKSMAEAINDLVIADRHGIVITGTHGKTTTTALTAHLLSFTGFSPRAIVGGQVKGYELGFGFGNGPAVIEGDEYETSFFDKGPKFWHYRANTLVIGNIEMDHLDNFKNIEEIENAFIKLIKKQDNKCIIIAGTESEHVLSVAKKTDIQFISFGISGKENSTAKDIRFSEDGTTFDWLLNGKNIGRFNSPLYGTHNLKNVIAALTSSVGFNPDIEKLKNGLASFKGVRRRQDIIYRNNDIIIIDDFGHHPTAIRDTLNALKTAFKNRRIIACVEPRSYTMQTKLHENALLNSFSAADIILLAPIPKTGNLPVDKRLDVGYIADMLKKSGKDALSFISNETLFEHLLKTISKGDLLVFFSSGDFAKLPEGIVKTLLEGNL